MEVFVLLNNGTCMFKIMGQFDAGSQFPWIATADLNSHGKVDLTTAKNVPEGVSILSNH